MKAVNLIPADEARAARGAGRSGGGVYVLLGALVLAVVMVSTWAYLGQSVRTKEAEAQTVQAAADAAEKKAGALKAYTDFATLRERRTETVSQLAKSRFDWPHALRDVARTVPKQAWVTTLRATVGPNVSVDGTADPLRQALSVPAIEVTGCATTHQNVARTISAMRRIDGVKRVSLSSTAKGEGGGTAGCGEGPAAAKYPKFSMTVFFDSPTDKAATAASGTAATTGGSTP